LSPKLRQKQLLQFLESFAQVFGLTVGIPARYPNAGGGPVSQEFTPEFVSYPNLRRFMSNDCGNFLALSYDELEQLNLKAKEHARNTFAVHKIQEERIKYLTDEKRIKAVRCCLATWRPPAQCSTTTRVFIKSWITDVDGSSIRGLHGAAGEHLRLAMIGARFLGARRCVWFRQVLVSVT